MRNTIESLARSSRRALFGVLTVLAVALPSVPAGADPTFTYSTYLGGELHEAGAAVAAQGGNTFIAGTKVSPSGSILWTTYLGGSHFDQSEKIRVAADGSLIVVGMTWSPDFPTLNAIQPALRGPQDLFLVRLKPWAHGSLRPIWEEAVQTPWNTWATARGPTLPCGSLSIPPAAVLGSSQSSMPRLRGSGLHPAVPEGNDTWEGHMANHSSNEGNPRTVALAGATAAQGRVVLFSGSMQGRG